MAYELASVVTTSVICLCYCLQVKCLVIYFWLTPEVLIPSIKLICKRTSGTRLTIFECSFTLVFQHLEKEFLRF